MAKEGGKVSRTIVWVILLLLIVGLAGFGVTNFGGSLRGIGTVGDTEISVDRYARALRQQLRQFEAQTGEPVSFSQAQQLGLDRAVLRQQVSLAALEDEADELGLSVGDAVVRRELLRQPSFQGLDGKFDRQAYEFAMEQAGLSTAEFEDTIRDETARTLLQSAVIAGVTPPEVYVDTLYDYAREQRDITAITFTPDDLEQPLPEPGTETLRAHYEANPDEFTLPKRRRITYAWARPEMLTDTVEVNEDALRRVYEERGAQFNQPERRLVERLVFGSEEEARQAADAIAAGETDFDTLVEKRGLTLDDVNLGEMTRDDLGAAAGPVFALEEPGIAGPVETDLGPALFRVNAILTAQSTSFEEARPELRAEYALDTARRALEEEIQPIEDLLAGGATLEDLAEETPLQLGEIVWTPGEAGAGKQEIDAYPAFRQAAAAAEPGDFPELRQLEDGGLFALRLDEVMEPSLQPFEDVTDQVRASWRAAETKSRLEARAEEALAALEGGTAPEELGGTLRQFSGLLRDEAPEGLPQRTVRAAFGMEPGAAQVIETAEGAMVLRLDAVIPADSDSEQAARIKQQLKTSVGQGYARDMMEAFTAALEARKGIQLDRSAIRAVHSQFP